MKTHLTFLALSAPFLGACATNSPFDSVGNTAEFVASHVVEAAIKGKEQADCEERIAPKLRSKAQAAVTCRSLQRQATASSEQQNRRARREESEAFAAAFANRHSRLDTSEMIEEQQQRNSWLLKE